MNTQTSVNRNTSSSFSERESFSSYCKKYGKQSLLNQWDHNRNSEIDPDVLSAKSHRRVWWKCEKGHEWQAQVNSRVRGSGCPVCTNRIVVAGENDLATVHPALAAQWHDEKNFPLTPKDVTAGCHNKVWWKCEKGHEWQAAVYSRCGGAGCPVCAGKTIIAGVNDLESAFPHVAAQWHETKNGTLKPTEITPFSNRNVWWRCENGHEYRASVAHRTQERSECPYCTGRKVLVGFNDLAAREPQIAEQWASELNGALTPEMVTVSSHKKVWWKCADGHIWKARIASRTCDRRHGCPVCAGRVRDGKAYEHIMLGSVNVPHHSDTSLTDNP